MREMAIVASALLAAGTTDAQDRARGAELYVSFCSACHGPEARGDGPMAPILEVLPADLTKLAAENGGVFPTAAVAQKIDGRDPVLAHGGPMPLFGEFFSGEGAATRAETGQPIVTSPEIVDLLVFLEAIQD